MDPTLRRRSWSRMVGGMVAVIGTVALRNRKGAPRRRVSLRRRSDGAEAEDMKITALQIDELQNTPG
jgi:hypothetical protein